MKQLPKFIIEKLNLNGQGTPISSMNTKDKVDYFMTMMTHKLYGKDWVEDKDNDIAYDNINNGKKGEFLYDFNEMYISTINYIPHLSVECLSDVKINSLSSVRKDRMVSLVGDVFTDINNYDISYYFINAINMQNKVIISCYDGEIRIFDINNKKYIHYKYGNNDIDDIINMKKKITAGGIIKYMLEKAGAPEYNDVLDNHKTIVICGQNRG